MTVQRRQWARAWEQIVVAYDGRGESRKGPYHLYLNQDTRPCYLNFVRVYESSLELEDDHTRSVFADALAIPRLDQVDAIIREYGIVGGWRPSSVRVEVVSQGAQRILARDIPAHALWNTNLGHPSQANDSIALWFDLDEPRPPQSVERCFRAVLHATEMTDKELGLTPDHGMYRNDGSVTDEGDPVILKALQNRVTRLEAVVKRIAASAAIPDQRAALVPPRRGPKEG